MPRLDKRYAWACVFLYHVLVCHLFLQGVTSLRVLQGQSRSCAARIPTYRRGEDTTPCARENLPNASFSGCLSTAYEDSLVASVMARPSERLLGLRCGFVNDDSLLRLLLRRFGECEVVVTTVALSRGPLSSKNKPLSRLLPLTGASATAKEPELCFVAFVDHPGPYYTDHNGTSRGWRHVVVTPFYDSLARTAHALKVLGPRLFPNARVSIQVDNDLPTPADPLAVANRLPAHVVLATMRHPKSRAKLNHTNYDLQHEFVAVFKHLAMRKSPNRDLLDLFESYHHLRSRKHVMHGTGMINGAVVIYNHRAPCTHLFACMWHNEIAWLSMRTQISILFVAHILKLERHILVYDTLKYHGNVTWGQVANPHLQLAGRG